MEYEKIHYDVEPSYTDEFVQCSFEISAFSSPNTTHENTHELDFSSLVQLERDLLDFDSLDQDAITLAGLESGAANSWLGHEINQVFIQENVEFLSAEENSSSFANNGTENEAIILEESSNSITDLLLTGAEAVEAENWGLAAIVISRLNNILVHHENGDKPFNRLALFFTQSLHYKTMATTSTSTNPTDINVTQVLTTNKMSAFQMLQELSPYVKFAHFTANQSILEATDNDRKKVHVIDFDIMEGIQWPPLMVDLAARDDASLRITAVVSDTETWDAIHTTGRRLGEFAESLNLPFVFDQMVMEKEEDFWSIEVGPRSTLIANCMIHQLHMPHKGFSQVKTFLRGVSLLSPKIVVLVEEELFNFTKMYPSSMSFVEFFSEAIHHYTALSDSLVSGFCGDQYKLALRVVEKEFLGMRILDSVKQFPCGRGEKKLWRDGCHSLKGFRPIPMSSYSVSQAKFLVSLFGGGYWVQHEQCKLALCWKSRPLTTASIWVPTT